MDYLTALVHLLYYVFYPIVFVLTWAGAILFGLGAPLVHLGSFTLHGCIWPVRFLARFEVRSSQSTILVLDVDSMTQTLYVFLGVALLLGVATGTTLHYTSSFLTALMNLDGQPQEPPRGRTMASYRAGTSEKLQRKVIDRPSLGFAASPPLVDTISTEDFTKLLEQHRQSGRKSLWSTTILEEDETSDDGL
ncbi:MAG: hypothetical protein Q9176_006888 [Flavoplaca citrina]